MPIYEYECTSCGYRFEELQEMSAPKPAACPKCKGSVKKMLSAATPLSSRHAPHACCGRAEQCDGSPCAGSGGCGHGGCGEA